MKTTPKTRKKNILVSLTEKENKLLEEKAQKMGLKKTQYIRFKAIYEDQEQEENKDML